ncbi:MAG: rhomboid family intramembrane serine protease [Paludibacteraceae bacterium]|nr:rhomboid family intramembrane serine protease [Paludibacteraceae bacterium]
MRNLPVVTKNLLLANVVIWLLDAWLRRYNIQLAEWLGLMNWSYSAFDSGFRSFQIWQPLTYMFMHADFSHLFCNMFAVLMFGPSLEREWGERKFLLYYIVCGLGAALVQELVWMAFMPTLPTVTIGASGAVFGILFAFGWLFPDVPLYIFFIPIPIRARIFVIVYAVIELFVGLGNVVGVTPGDNVAHFAHLGGMLFGWLLILCWQKGIFNGEWRERIHRDSDSREKGERDFSGYHYHKSE